MATAAPAAIGSRLAGPRAAIRGARELRRRGTRFSWWCWGFLFALWAGVFVVAFALAFFPVVTTTTTATGTATSTEPPLWAYPLAAPAPVLMLVLALRELRAGRRAADRVARGLDPGVPADPSDTGGWTEQLVEAQRLVTTAKSEVEWSILPVAIGLLTAGTAVGEFLEMVLVAAGGALASVEVLGVFIELIGAAVAIVGSVLIWRASRDWIRGFQGFLDREARDFSQLEAEFLWRFTGSSP